MLWNESSGLTHACPGYLQNSHPASRDYTFPSTTYTMLNMFQLQAYHRGIRYPHHVLLTLGWYGQNWWRVEDPNLSCTAQERESVLNRSLAFLQCDFLEDLNTTTDTAIVNLPPCLLALYSMTRYINVMLIVTLFYSRLVGNILLKSRVILVYHHFTLNS